MKKWETALLLGLAFTLLWGAKNVRTQEELADRVIRLHVVANSDSAADQALKKSVRDAVLDCAAAVLQDSGTVEDAAEALRTALPELEAAAARETAARGYDYAVSAQLAREEFPRRDYDTFSLPSGQYLSLRITIGAGAGRNWWCVVYPDLCHSAAAAWEGLEEGQVGLITEESPRYVLKFRAVEWWQALRQKLGK